VNKAEFSEILRRNEERLLSEWMRAQQEAVSSRNRIADTDLREQSKHFLELLQEAVTIGGAENVRSASFEPVRRFLTQISSSRATLGFTPTETATFVFSFKQPLFSVLREVYKAEPEVLADETWQANLLLDKLGLFTTEAYQTTREEVIRRQQQEMMELSTPVVKLWDGILALPIIGTLDSSRTQTIMESLLEKIVESGSEIAIIDITGVPTVDTLTAQHLLKTVTAARLMGAECIISGIRPQIAQTIVHLGVELGDVATKASLADAFRIALKRSNLQVTKVRSADRQGSNGRAG
jgi:rsbT co-antagonist protein RsbR